MCELQDELESTIGNITWVKEAIADWRIILADLRRAGQLTEVTKSTLRTFNSTLEKLESYQIFLRGEINRQRDLRCEMIPSGP